MEMDGDRIPERLERDLLKTVLQHPGDGRGRHWFNGGGAIDEEGDVL